MKRRTAATRMTNCNVVMVGQQGLQAPPTEEGHGPAGIRRTPCLLRSISEDWHFAPATDQIVSGLTGGRLLVVQTLRRESGWMRERNAIPSLRLFRVG